MEIVAALNIVFKMFKVMTDLGKVFLL